MEAPEQFFSSMEPFVMLSTVVQTSYVLAWILNLRPFTWKLPSRTVLSCGTLYHSVYGGSTFQGEIESVDEILKCNQSNQYNWAALSSRALKNTVHESIFNRFKAVA